MLSQLQIYQNLAVVSIGDGVMWLRTFHMNNELEGHFVVGIEGFCRIGGGI